MSRKSSYFNSHDPGMPAARPKGFKIDFVRNPIPGSAAWFFVIILKFILTPIFEIKIREKKFLDTKKILKSSSSQLWVINDEFVRKFAT